MYGLLPYISTLVSRTLARVRESSLNVAMEYQLRYARWLQAKEVIDAAPPELEGTVSVSHWRPR